MRTVFPVCPLGQRCSPGHGHAVAAEMRMWRPHGLRSVAGRQCNQAMGLSRRGPGPPSSVCWEGGPLRLGLTCPTHSDPPNSPVSSHEGGTCLELSFPACCIDGADCGCATAGLATVGLPLARPFRCPRLALRSPGRRSGPYVSVTEGQLGRGELKAL